MQIHTDYMTVQLRETYCCHCRKSVDFQIGSPESYKRTDFKKMHNEYFITLQGQEDVTGLNVAFVNL